MSMTDVRAQYTEEAVGANHPTLSDTMNRLVKGLNNFRLILSGGNLTLVPINGNLVDINDVIYACTAMPTLSAAGLTPGALYYIYLYNNGGAEALEASLTAYTVDAKGRANKTGDLTRRLMGMARPIAGPAWQDAAAQRYVRSYDNRLPTVAINVFAASRTTASNSLVEISSTERAEFLIWADEVADAMMTSPTYNSLTTSSWYVGVGIDGTGTTDYQAVMNDPVATDYFMAVARYPAIALTEGYHYATIVGLTSAGTATFLGGAAGGRTAISVVIHPAMR